MDTRTLIAKRVAQEFKEGDVVNLGIGIPTLAAEYLPSNINITLQSENGFVGLGPVGEVDIDLTNAGGQPAGIVLGGATFDSALSFGIIRGGHVDTTVLGALEVDKEGNLANWMVPGKIVPGMGGAMDLVVGAKKVIVAMEHVGKKGDKKILQKCTLPLTAVHVVDLIITNMCVFEVTEKGLVLTELAPGISKQMVRDNTEADYLIAPDLKEMQIN